MFSITTKVSPAILYIDGSAGCQLRCPTCPTTGRSTPPLFGSGYLHFQDLKALLERNPQIRSVELENRGELFLNPDLLRIIEYAHQKGIALTSNTGVNLNTVGEGVLEGLVKYGFRSLVCSIDGATPETYAIYRRRGDFNKVMAHIRTINHFKKVYGSEYPKLTWQFVVFGHNEHELPDARRMAAELGMGFMTKMSWDSAFSPIKDKEFVMAQTGWPAVTREEYAAITGDDYMRSVCLALWHGPRINWDGRVLGCCWNTWAEFGMNAFADGLVPAMNSEKMAYARRMLQGKVPPRPGIPCTTCSLYIKRRETGHFLGRQDIDLRPAEGFPMAAARFIYRVSGLRRLRAFLRSRGTSGPG